MDLNQIISPSRNITNDPRIPGMLKFYLKYFGEKSITKKCRSFYLNEVELASTARRHRRSWCGKFPTNDEFKEMLDNAFEEVDQILIDRYEITKIKSGGIGYYYKWKVAGEPEPVSSLKKEPLTHIRWHHLEALPTENVPVIPNFCAELCTTESGGGGSVHGPAWR